ncbi:hypothetical protein ACTWQF_32655 [Streptomyces sp. 8N114]|uniref:hypothetical protein n=1 Tax=Streptomyces sp. 8N114 TaxID=3457419 RepID=UPI003FCF7F37
MPSEGGTSAAAQPQGKEGESQPHERHARAERQYGQHLPGRPGGDAVVPPVGVPGARIVGRVQVVLADRLPGRARCRGVPEGRRGLQGGPVIRAAGVVAPLVPALLVLPPPLLLLLAFSPFLPPRFFLPLCLFLSLCFFLSPCVFLSPCLLSPCLFLSLFVVAPFVFSLFPLPLFAPLLFPLLGVAGLLCFALSARLLALLVALLLTL